MKKIKYRYRKNSKEEKQEKKLNKRLLNRIQVNKKEELDYLLYRFKTVRDVEELLDEARGLLL